MADKFEGRPFSTSLWLVLLTLLSLAFGASAYDLVHEDVSNTLYYRSLVERNIIITDDSHDHHLWSRQNSNQTGSGSAPVLNTATGLPTPFDTSIGSNFTDSACPNYFSSFLSDATFQSCLPISLLLQNSISFFQALRSTSLLQKTLDVSCNASLAVCSPLMEKIATNLVSSGNCQVDYQRQNPIVMQALAGLKAYEALYQASCMKDSTTQQGCFFEAMESANADDAYPYYTAIGLALPPSAKPACQPCLRQTMGIFEKYASQSDQPLADTYLGCATQLNNVCGAGFVNTEVKTASKAKASGAPAWRISKTVAILSFVSIMVGQSIA